MSTTNPASISDIKDQLLRTLCSADRGLAADKQLASRVAELAMALEAAGEPVNLTWGGPAQPNNTPGSSPSSPPSSSPQTSGLAMLNGTWRLVYSSGFVDGSLGGSRPGPPSVVAPFILGQVCGCFVVLYFAGVLVVLSCVGVAAATFTSATPRSHQVIHPAQVYQVIATYTNRLDNVVDLQFKAGLPTNLIPGITGPPPLVTATLKHSFSVENTATIRIVFDGTEVKTRGGINDVLNQIPTFDIPQFPWGQLPEALQPVSREVRSATFDVTYLDGDLRITRGDRGELRVYLRP